MKKLITVIFLFVSFFANAQKVKHVDVFVSKETIISYMVRYNGESPHDTTYYFTAKDNRYESLYELITIQRASSIQEIYDYLKKAKEMCIKEDDGVSDEVQGSTISVAKIGSTKYVFMYGIDNDSSGYSLKTAGSLTIIMDAIKKYCINNKITLVP